MKNRRAGETLMKSLPVMFCAVLMTCLLTGSTARADDNKAIVDLAKKVIAEDKARFGIDMRKCRLECERVYSEKHCIAKCDEIATELRDEGFERERLQQIQTEEQKPIKYKDAAEKYR